MTVHTDVDTSTQSDEMGPGRLPETQAVPVLQHAAQFEPPDRRSHTRCHTTRTAHTASPGQSSQTSPQSRSSEHRQNRWKQPRVNWYNLSDPAGASREIYPSDRYSLPQRCSPGSGSDSELLRTLGVGTRIALAVSFPSRSGRILATALAAAVSVITIFSGAPRPRRLFLW